MNMLAARDQENRIHGQQAAAAAKPLNQGSRQLAPKTPGNKAPKTPFKIPLNDENGIGAGIGGKNTVLTGKAKGNENVVIGGGKASQNAFVTPAAPKIRAPLGAKTTNLKTQAFRTPAPVLVDKNVIETARPSATARKARPRLSHAEMTKVQVFGDEAFVEREVEYCPPRVADLPDTHDDLPELNLDWLKGTWTMAGCEQYHYNKLDSDGLSLRDRDRMREEESKRIHDLEMEAAMQKALDCSIMPCFHEPECEDECKDMPEVRRRAQEKYEAAIAEIHKKKEVVRAKPSKAATSSNSSRSALPVRPRMTAAGAKLKGLSIPPLKSKAPVAARAPLAAKSAATATSNRSLASNGGNSLKHAAATAASRTTLGYSKGRKVSGQLQQIASPRNRAANGVGVGVEDLAGLDLEAMRMKEDFMFEGLTW